MSNIAVLSVNHQLAPVEIREKVAFAQNELPLAVSSLLNVSDIKGCVIFSTCNRSEIYVSHSSKNIREVLIQYMASTHAIDQLSLEQYVSFFESNEAIEHTCKVACGLESLVLGEPQIFGQLKEAYQFSKTQGALDKIWKNFFNMFSRQPKKLEQIQILVRLPSQLPIVPLNSVKKYLQTLKIKQYC